MKISHFSFYLVRHLWPQLPIEVHDFAKCSIFLKTVLCLVMKYKN
jgi:hypothetical protein